MFNNLGLITNGRAWTFQDLISIPVMVNRALAEIQSDLDAQGINVFNKLDDDLPASNGLLFHCVPTWGKNADAP